MKLDVTVPTSLSDISLRDYQRFIKIASDKDIGDVFIRQKMVQIFCNVPLLAVNKMSRKDFVVISNALIEILQQKPKLQPIAKISGKEYGFIPNLDNDMTLGEFVDLDTYMTDWENFHKAMSVLYRPVKNKKGNSYTIEKYEGNENNWEEMLDARMDVVMGAVVFFLDFKQTVIKNYPEVFNAGSSEGQEGGGGFGKKWGWYQHVHKLAGGSVFKIGDATSLHLGTALLFLAYDREYNDEMIKGMKSKSK